MKMTRLSLPVLLVLSVVLAGCDDIIRAGLAVWALGKLLAFGVAVLAIALLLGIAAFALVMNWLDGHRRKGAKR